MKQSFSKFIWGSFLLLAAAVIVINQLNGFAAVGISSIAVAVLALAFIVKCLTDAHFAPLPMPLAVLYIVFHDALGLPYIQAWALILASVLAWIGLGILIPRRPWYNCIFTNTTVKRNVHVQDDNP